MALMFGGRVDFWNRQGEWLNSIMLQDYGQVLGENQYPAYTNIVAFEHQLITLANSEASVWNCNGTRIARVRLDDVEGTYDIYWSLSVANGLLWLVDEQSHMFRGYQFYQQEKATNDDKSCCWRILQDKSNGNNEHRQAAAYSQAHADSTQVRNQYIQHVPLNSNPATMLAVMPLMQSLLFALLLCLL